MNPSLDSLVGRVFAGYQLLSILGSGGAGTVYLAAQVDAPERQVAVKVLTPPAQAAAADLVEFKARFQREAKALKLLDHPHILSLISYGEDEESGLAYMVLPYMSGGTLGARLRQGGLPLEDAGRYAAQIADALDYAHQQGVVHRDLKPGNMLLDAHGEVFLADFGIAKIFDAAGTTMVTLTSTGQIMGTADYMSPEQAQGQDVTAASDVYSFGMLLYHLVTGQVAFEGKSLTQVLLQIATTPPIPPRRLRPTLPAPAEAAILRALAKQPVDRFTSAGELAEAFGQGLRDEWAPGLRQAATVDAFVPQQTVTAPRGAGGAAALTRPPVLIAGVSALVIVALFGTLLLTGVFPGRPGGSGLVANGGSPTATGIGAATGSPARTVTPGQPTTTAGANATATTGQPAGGGGGGGGTQPTPTNTAVSPTATPNPHPIVEFSIPTPNSDGRYITSGPGDGNLWFTEYFSPSLSKIGRITTGGTITEFTIPTADSSPFRITAGPDGNLWFTEADAAKIGVLLTASGNIGEISTTTAGSGPWGITAGPDGNLWFTESGVGKIGRITTGGSITEFPLPGGAGSGPTTITTGPDGALWFTEESASKIGRITTSGSISEFPVLTANGQPVGITLGPDGNLWFTEQIANKIGRITTGGSITEFPLPTANSLPQGITTGVDGNLWFAEQAGCKIGRITTGGSVTEFTPPTAGSGDTDITSGPDGKLWFVESATGKIGRITP